MQNETQSPSVFRRSSRSHSDALLICEAVIGCRRSRASPGESRSHPELWHTEKEGAHGGSPASPMLSRQRFPSAVLKRVEPDRERDRQPAVELTVGVARKVEHVAVAQLELS